MTNSWIVRVRTMEQTVLVLLDEATCGSAHHRPITGEQARAARALYCDAYEAQTGLADPT